MKTLKVSIKMLAVSMLVAMASCDEKEIVPESPQVEMEELKEPTQVKPKMETRVSIKAADFNEVFKEMADQNMFPVYIDGFLHTAGVANDAKTGTYFNLIFKEKTENIGHYYYHGLTESGLNAKIIDLAQDEFNLVFLESYELGNEIRYAAIFKTGEKAEFLPKINIPIGQWQNVFNNAIDDGYRLATKSIVWHDGAYVVTGLFDNKNVGGWMTKSLQSPSEMQSLMEQQDDAGRSVSHFDVTQKSSTDYTFGAIFNTEIVSEWYALNGLTLSQLNSEIAKADAKGYTMQTIDAYDKYTPINGNEYYTTYYVASWRKK